MNKPAIAGWNDEPPVFGVDTPMDPAIAQEVILQPQAPVAPDGAIDYFTDDDDGVQAPATLERLSQMAKRSGQLDEAIARLSVDLAELEAELGNIKRTLIPNIMAELGLESFKMDDGRIIEVKNSVNASITENHKPAAFKWLREHDFDGIIKTKISADFGKGEAGEAQKAAEALREAGFTPTVDEGVHPATLKAFVRERLEEGDEIPTDVFGIFEFKEAKIKLPKKKK